MSQKIQFQRWMRAMESEERKDEEKVQKIKKDYINEIKKYRKEDLFPKPKKLTLWQKIKTIILGN